MHFTSTVVAFLWDSLHMPLSSAHGAGLRLQGSASASHQQPMDKMDKDEALSNSSMLLLRLLLPNKIIQLGWNAAPADFGCGASDVSLLINPYRSTSRRSLRISFPWYHPDLDEPHPLGCQSPQLELLQAWKRPNNFEFCWHLTKKKQLPGPSITLCFWGRWFWLRFSGSFVIFWGRSNKKDPFDLLPRKSWPTWSQHRTFRLWCPLSFSVHKVSLSPFLEPWSVCF